MSINSGLLVEEIADVIRETKKVNSLDGEVAVCGVWEGASAMILASIFEPVKVHVFDTFGGLPEPTPEDMCQFQKGHYCCSLKEVQNNLINYDNILYYAGLFKDTQGRVADKQFKFVHIDFDLYASTKEALSFFYPRLVPGGLMMIHDYYSLAAIQQAVHETCHPRLMVGCSAIIGKNANNT